MLILLLCLFLFVFATYPEYKDYQYKDYQHKKSLKKLDKSLVELQKTLHDTLDICKNKKSE